MKEHPSLKRVLKEGQPNQIVASAPIAAFNPPYRHNKNCLHYQQEMGHPASHYHPLKLDKNTNKDTDAASGTPKSTKQKAKSKTVTNNDSSVSSIKQDLAQVQDVVAKQLFTPFSKIQAKIADLSSKDSDSESSLGGQDFYEAHDLGLDLRKVILLDNQSTEDVFCNNNLVSDITKLSDRLSLTCHGGTSMTARHEAKVNGYHRGVWFSKKVITNIVSLHILTKQFPDTYDSLDQSFMVHRGALPELHFCVHRCGISYCTPPEGTPFTFGIPVIAQIPGVDLTASATSKITGVTDELHVVTHRS
jgi:hypothetical protein